MLGRFFRGLMGSTPPNAIPEPNNAGSDHVARSNGDKLYFGPVFVGMDDADEDPANPGSHALETHWQRISLKQNTSSINMNVRDCWNVRGITKDCRMQTLAVMSLGRLI